MTKITTIKIDEETKGRLDLFRESPTESYDFILNKLVWIAGLADEKPEESQRVVKEINNRRKIIQKKGLCSKEILKDRFKIKC